MKKNISLLLRSLLFFMAVDAQAQECCDAASSYFEGNCCVNEKNFYSKIFSGLNFLQNTSFDGTKPTYQKGYIFAASVGYYCNDGMRLEAEYAFRKNSIKEIQFFSQGLSKHGHFQTSSYMVNLLWDLPLSTCKFALLNIQPFIGVGIGYDSQQMHSNNSRIVFNEKWNHFSWQIMAGLAYPIFCNTEITLEYKFHQGGCHCYNHSIGVGLVYNFGCLR